MTPEERQMLTDLANKIAQTPPPAHDADAEEFIRTHIGNRPDALYLMTQTVLIQNMAIDHAHQEIQQLKQNAAPYQQPAQGGSFTGGGGWQQQQNAPPPLPQAQYVPQNPASPPQGGVGSFLRSAGTTAAGVAAGALAFEGIRSMFGGVGHMFGFGNQPQFGGSSFLGGAPGGETIVNNYYDRPEDRDATPADDLGPDDSVQYDDTSVADDPSASFADDTSDDSSSNDDLV